MKSLIDTLVWIPTNSKYKNFNYILKEINNLKLKNFIYVITYNNFSEKISKIIDQKDYENFIYISKKEINIEVDNSFRNINKIHDYLLEHLNIKIKYFIISSDDDLLINRDVYIRKIELLDNDSDLLFVCSPVILKNDITNEIINFETNYYSGESFLKFFISNNGAQHATINSIFKYEESKNSGSLEDLGLHKRGLWDGFGIDYNLFFKLAFIPNKKVMYINDKPDRIIRQHDNSMTARYPIQFSYCYYLYSSNIVKSLIKKYNLKSDIFESLLVNRLQELIRCFFVVHIHNKEEAITPNKSFPKHFIIYFLKEIFFNLKSRNILKMIFYLYKYYLSFVKIKKKIFIG